MSHNFISFVRRGFVALIMLGLLLPQLAHARVASAAPVEQGGCPAGTVRTTDRYGRVYCMPKPAAPANPGAWPAPQIQAQTRYLGYYGGQPASFKIWMAAPVGAALVVAAADGPLPVGDTIGVVILSGATVGYIIVVYGPQVATTLSDLINKCETLVRERLPHLRTGDYREEQRVANAKRIAQAANGAPNNVPPPNGCWHRDAGVYDGVYRDEATIVDYTVAVFKAGGKKYSTVSVLYNVSNMQASTVTHGSTIQIQAGWRSLPLGDARCGVAHNVAKLIVNSLIR